MTDAAPGRFAHLAYLAALAGKTLIATAQLAAAATLLLSPPGAAARVAHRMARAELDRDPGDWLAPLVERTVANGELSAGGFYTIYLLLHGLLNAALVIVLVRHVRGSFTLATAALVTFIAYQVWEFARTGDPVLLALCAYDLVVITLVRLEARRTGLRLARTRPA